MSCFVYLLCVVVFRIVCAQGISPFSASSLEILREEAREMFFHGYNNYITHGWPDDEIQPISCRKRSHIKKVRGTLDDVLGGYMLTLVDSLSTLLVMREFEEFEDALKLLESVTFDTDVSVSVFEANIRVVGGLLSAHQLAVRLFPEVSYDGYTLLDMAQNLASRLLPAFDTPTGIPLHIVNLRTGNRIRKPSPYTCPAAGGTFLLEMGLLSRLTGNATYETKASRALYSIWSRRSSIDLVGSLIDTSTGKWKQFHSGVGAGIDSFFETMLKAYIVLGGDDALFLMFHKAYEAAQKHTLHKGVHIEVDMNQGRSRPYSFYVSSLQAFWPSLQILAGHVKEAISAFDSLATLWDKYKALPDIYDLGKDDLLHYARDYPLRPELVESAYHLYTVTRDDKYLLFGRQVIFSLQNTSRVKCGFASIADVYTGRLDDRMDSYFLAETVKYLFLLFDEALPQETRGSVFCQNPNIKYTAAAVTSDEFDGNAMGVSRRRERAKCIDIKSAVFSTEGHVLLAESSFRMVRELPHSHSNAATNHDYQCRAYGDLSS